MLTIAEANVESVDPGMLEAIRVEALREGAASDVQRPPGSRSSPRPEGDRSPPGRTGRPFPTAEPVGTQIFSRPSQ